MNATDILLLVLLQIPLATLAGAGLYLALRVRTPGSVLIAVSLALMLIKSVGSNFIPKTTRHVFDEEGQFAGAMMDSGNLDVWLGYVGFALTVLLALGLVLVARDPRFNRHIVSPDR